MMDDENEKVPFLKEGRIINPGLLTKLIGEQLDSEEKEARRNNEKSKWH